MKPEATRERLLARFAANGVSLQDLTPALAVAELIAFYVEERVEGCALDEAGDMLLFEWGSYDWGEGEFFRFSFTRQYLTKGEKVSQLVLSFAYVVTTVTSALDAGNRWCGSPTEVNEFRRFVEDSEAFRLAQTQRPVVVKLEFGTE